ncbi:MAG TPA: DUF2784 domain-containing protein [Steroidobacteraceae bacterium]|jgi:hypothetical protein|nr:DUF2784 domain-containing protein [Steroidobacteraceae bacterium]
MAWRLLADLLVAIHLAFAAFVVCGGFLAWKWRWIAFAHLPALAWGFWVETSGQICPLTPLEIQLRRLAGEAGYQGGFLDHYVVPLLYPPGLTRPDQWVLAGLLLALNIVAYGALLRPRRHLRGKVP